MSTCHALLDRYQALRAVEVLRLQNAAWNAMEWFEVCGTRYCDPLEPEQFMYSLLTRSQRISHENLRLRDAGWLEGYERWFAQRGAAPWHARRSRPPRSRGAWSSRPDRRPRRCSRPSRCDRDHVEEPRDRVADGAVLGDRRHGRRLPPRAPGRPGAGRRGAGDGRDDLRQRRRPHHASGCPGLYTEAQGDAWARIVDWVHTHSDAHIGMQLGHAGAKGATHIGWEGIDQPLDSGGWPLVSASAQQYLPGVSDWSRAMTRADMDRVLHDFVLCTRRAAAAGFDWLELHCAHGYLLSSFISPLTNQARGRLRRLAGEPAALSAGGVRGGARRVAGGSLPMSVRISTHDWVDGGITPARCRRDRARLQGRRRGHDRLLVGPGQQGREAGLRPHVPDPVRRPRAQRGRRSRRSPSARSARPTTSTASSPRAAPTCAPSRGRTWPTRRGRSPRPRASAGSRSSWPAPYRSAKPQLEAIFQRERAAGGNCMSAARPPEGARHAMRSMEST